MTTKTFPIDPSCYPEDRPFSALAPQAAALGLELFTHVSRTSPTQVFRKFKLYSHLESWMVTNQDLETFNIRLASQLRTLEALGNEAERRIKTPEAKREFLYTLVGAGVLDDVRRLGDVQSPSYILRTWYSLGISDLGVLKDVAKDKGFRKGVTEANWLDRYEVPRIWDHTHRLLQEREQAAALAIRICHG